MVKQGVWLCIFLFHVTVSWSQVDTEFWFAPPEVTSGHGDRPIYLRISTLGQAASVQVRQPARSNTLLASVTIPANTTHTVDLTNQIAFIEPSNPAQALTTGIRVVSSAPVTAYYEVGATWNTDIYSLKGRNALGNKFVIPAQNQYANSAQYSPIPYFAFDIVAVRNNTVVKIKPTRPLYGHVNAQEITIKLNAGQTYSFRKISVSALDNPVGTIVESTRPIAVTITDDSVINGGCRDVLGDQLVPVEVAGSEYVVLKGFLFSQEYLFITAIEDNTEIFVGGDEIPAATLPAGGLYRLPVVSQSTYILSNKNIYVLHVTGFGCEMGMALLPSINCKGSDQIGFSRTTSEFFGLNILVRKEGTSGFRLNGSSTLVPSSAFLPVPGTNDKWYAAQLSFNTSQIPVNTASLISNSQHSFQIGIINGNETSSCRYGYFSSFSTLFIGDDFDMCEGETATLNAGPGKESYLWNTGSTDMQISITNPGTYWVRVEKEDCVLYDTIQVNVKKGKIDLGPDVEICEGDVAIIDGKENFSWQWSDGSSSRYLSTSLPGKYWISVFDYTGCQASDTVYITAKPYPVVDLGPDILKCPKEDVVIDATQAGATYVWQDGATSPLKLANDAGTYWCEVTVNGCSTTGTVIIENLPGPQQDSLFGSPSVCPAVQGVEYRVEEIAGTTYQWFVSGGVKVYDDGPSIKVDWGVANNQAMVKAFMIDSDGCEGDTLFFPVRINVQLAPRLPDGPDTICLNNSLQVIYKTTNTNGSVYEWFIEGGEIIAGQGTSQVMVDWPTGSHSLWVEESSITTDTVCAGVSEKLFVYIFKDEASLTLFSVSVDTAAEANIKINLSVGHMERVKDNKVYVYKKVSDQDDWQLAAELPAQTTSFTDPGNATDEHIYDYFVTLVNLCEEELVSVPHNTVRLAGLVDPERDEIHFSWNPYEGWMAGVEHYELWRKLEDGDFTMMAVVPSSQTAYSATTLSAFDHRYSVLAVEKSGPGKSWSNSLGFSFEHEVFIPNVITPNGDPHNQFFEIKNILLFSDTQLQIFNRYGTKVYETKGYNNDWDGGGLESGVYFYILHLKRNNKILKGTISILR